MLQIFALLASSQSKFFISARARKKIAVLGMLANARKDHSSPLKLSPQFNTRFFAYFHWFTASVANDPLARHDL